MSSSQRVTWHANLIRCTKGLVCAMTEHNPHTLSCTTYPLEKATSVSDNFLSEWTSRGNTYHMRSLAQISRSDHQVRSNPGNISSMPTYGHDPHIIADDANYGFWQGSRTLVEDKVHVCRMQTGQPTNDLPESLREDMIREHHDTPMSDHFTWKRTLDLISRSGGLVYGTRYRLRFRCVTLANGAKKSTIDHLDYCPP